MRYRIWKPFLNVYNIHIYLKTYICYIKKKTGAAIMASHMLTDPITALMCCFYYKYLLFYVCILSTRTKYFFLCIYEDDKHEGFNFLYKHIQLMKIYRSPDGCVYRVYTHFVCKPAHN